MSPSAHPPYDNPDRITPQIAPQLKSPKPSPLACHATTSALEHSRQLREAATNRSRQLCGNTEATAHILSPTLPYPQENEEETNFVPHELKNTRGAGERASYFNFSDHMNFLRNEHGSDNSDDGYVDDYDEEDDQNNNIVSWSSAHRREHTSERELETWTAKYEDQQTNPTHITSPHFDQEPNEQSITYLSQSTMSTLTAASISDPTPPACQLTIANNSTSTNTKTDSNTKPQKTTKRTREDPSPGQSQNDPNLTQVKPLSRHKKKQIRLRAKAARETQQPGGNTTASSNETTESLKLAAQIATLRQNIASTKRKQQHLASTSTTSQPERKKIRQACEQYLAGKCKLGDTCQYWHSN